MKIRYTYFIRNRPQANYCKLSLNSTCENDMQVTLAIAIVLFSVSSQFLIKLYLFMLSSLYPRECDKKVIEDCLKYVGNVRAWNKLDDLQFTSNDTTKNTFEKKYIKWICKKGQTDQIYSPWQMDQPWVSPNRECLTVPRL